MYCHQCGEKLVEGSRFCSRCGCEVQMHVDVANNEGTAEAIDAAGKQDEMTTEQMEAERTETSIAESSVQPEEGPEIDEMGGQQESSSGPFMRYLPILVPVISFIFVAAGLGFYYFQEKEMNSQVLDLKESAEELALKREYKKAMKLLEKAQSKRPNYTALQDSRGMIEKAMGYEDVLGKVSENIKKTQFDEASKELASLKERLTKEKAPLFDRFNQEVEDHATKITIGTIKKELNELNTVDQLGGKLSILATLPEENASVVKKEILNKIVQISSRNVESELAKKQFSEAFSMIKKGLQFAVNDEKLLALKDRVEQDKLAFEQAEQQKIEKAMEAAAQEDLKNRTAAVEVSDFSVEVDEYGDLYLSGNVKNVATKTIGSITIYYTIYDENDMYLSDGLASVYPYYLEPGDLGSFEDIYYGVSQNVHVEIDNITWYLN
ncbi:FxLYD domain-containing protein [Cytobacillus sp. FJAT-53684]|uniref:FxLYD domain-containing protein n=1 Tax=Cytobacillus mangrovibacter TaxID=3299024 RepID=A0ABW6K316_9BACI